MWLFPSFFALQEGRVLALWLPVPGLPFWQNLSNGQIFPKKNNWGEEGHEIRLYSEEHKWGCRGAGRDWRGEMCYLDVRGRQIWREDSKLSATEKSGRPRARCQQSADGIRERRAATLNTS